MINMGILLQNKQIVNNNIQFGRRMFQNTNDIPIIDIFIVTEEYIARPDLISKKYFGTVDYWDVILRFNNIGNFMAINENMQLYIPDVYRIKIKEETIIPVKDTVKDNILQQFKNNKRLSEKDKKRIEYLKEKYGIDAVPVNILLKEDKVVTSNNTILLGGHLPQKDII